ncbi:MAG: regulatory protein RecX [Clostridia bacterium]|nr:regulatory protein RecX [Clostridia bacterium]
MEVTQVRRMRGMWYITLGGETLRIPRSLYEKRPIAEGDEIDPEEYDQWLLLRQYQPGLEYAVSLLAQRPYAEGELEARMLRLGYRPVTCEMVLHKLKKNNLLDDADFARQWAEARVRRGLGPQRIAGELRRKGVTAEETQAAMEALDEGEHVSAATALAAKFLRSGKPGEDRRKADQRVLAALARRGYPYAIAKEALRAAREGSDNTEDPYDD